MLSATLAAFGSIVWGKNLTPESAEKWFVSHGIAESEVLELCDRLLHSQPQKNEESVQRVEVNG